MTNPDEDRSSAARQAAELALVRVCNHYGTRPEFVLLGGLVPGLLCSDASVRHAGTSDVDVQVDLEISGGSVNAARLENALYKAGFAPDSERIWRWKSAPVDGPIAIIKFELLADLPTAPQGSIVAFEGSSNLGAANLRGTGFAARDIEVRTLKSIDQGTQLVGEVNVTGLAGFLLAKTAAAHGRHKAKDYYDIAFVLLHHDDADDTPARRVLAKFAVPASIRTPLIDLQANFTDTKSLGAEAYARQITQDHPDLDLEQAALDGVLAVQEFTSVLLAAPEE